MIIYQDTFLLIYAVLMAFIIGLVFGSFLNCMAWRIAHNESILHGRSHCITCSHTLSALDLVPVFSWVLLKGKCRYCGSKVSVRYPLTELCLGVLSVLCILKFDISLLYLRNFIFICILFTLSLVDLEIYEIPDSCHIVAIILWLISLPISDHLLKTVTDGLLGGFVVTGVILIVTLIMERLLHKEALGGGDIKLFFVSGLYLGLLGNFFMIIIACVLGIVFFYLRKDENKYIPFGPSISLAIFIVLLYGGPFIEWYLSLLM